MKFYGINQVEDSVIRNLTLDHDSNFPANPSLGELFFKTSAPIGLYCYNGTAWEIQGTPGGIGTIASQNADNVSITGGAITGATINNAAIGGTSPAAGRFTTVKLGGGTYNPYVLGVAPGSNIGWTNATDSAPGACMSSDGSHWRVLTGGGERLRITSGGAVLIGTATDDGASKLQVAGNVSITGGLIIGTSIGDGNNPVDGYFNTAAIDTNTTQVATTAFVLGQAGTSNPTMNGSAIVGTSLRFSRQDHVHPSDTSRAPSESPSFTGTPLAPTATAGTNTTQIATTAFVNNSISTALSSITIDGGSY